MQRRFRSATQFNIRRLNQAEISIKMQKRYHCLLLLNIRQQAKKHFHNSISFCAYSWSNRFSGIRLSLNRAPAGNRKVASSSRIYLSWWHSLTKHCKLDRKGVHCSVLARKTYAGCLVHTLEEAECVAFRSNQKIWNTQWNKFRFCFLQETIQVFYLNQIDYL